MPFINNILSHRSVSIVGLEKNTGKTETLNYVLSRLKTRGTQIALTSIGVDGEQTDSVTQTPKPEIVIPKGMIFVTSETHYAQKKLVSEILDVSEKRTALGRLITARALSEGKVILSGPAETAGVRKLIDKMKQFSVQTTVVDGALSRLSLASPAVTDAMILATGAALSANIPQLVRETAFVKRLIELPQIEAALAEKLQMLNQGLWAIDANGNVHDLEIPSVFLFDKRETDIFRFGTRIFVSGAISDKILSFLRRQNKKVELIVSDFTKIFVTQKEFGAFLRSGNSLKTVLQSRLIAVTINPVAPNGFVLDSETLQQEMEKALDVPVYDVKKIAVGYWLTRLTDFRSDG